LKSASGRLNLQRSLRAIADDHCPGLAKVTILFVIEPAGS
jgi:hypothetical protein